MGGETRDMMGKYKDRTLGIFFLGVTFPYFSALQYYRCQSVGDFLGDFMGQFTDNVTRDSPVNRGFTEDDVGKLHGAQWDRVLYGI